MAENKIKHITLPPVPVVLRDDPALDAPNPAQNVLPGAPVYGRSVPYEFMLVIVLAGILIAISEALKSRLGLFSSSSASSSTDSLGARPSL